MNVCMFFIKSLSMNFIKVVVHEPTKEKTQKVVFYDQSSRDGASLIPMNFVYCRDSKNKQGNQLHAVSRTHRQREPSVKTLHSPLNLITTN